MNQRDPHSKTRSAKNGLALVGAALALVVQLLATLHWHQPFLSLDATAQATGRVDGGSCALCLLAFHSPLNPVSPPAAHRLEFTQECLALQLSFAFRSLLASSEQGRAPPTF